MNKKAQAAMEYLMTYGWAILVIAVIFAILFIYIKPFGAVESCVPSSPAFSCQQVILNSQGVVSAKIISGVPNRIAITSIGCGQGSNPPNSFTPITNNVVVETGSYIPALWGSSTVKCDNVGNVGSTYNGKLYIKYKDADAPSNIPEKELQVSFITVVQQ
jgi:hypothetical protein